MQKIPGIDFIGLPLESRPKKKRKTLTTAQRNHIWDNPKIYGRKCSICGQRITKISELELDHTKSYKSGGTRLALAHRSCNRMKSSGSLARIQRTLGIKPARKKPHKRRHHKKKQYNPFDIKMPKIDLGI